MKNNNRIFFQLLNQYYPLIRELALTGRLFTGRDELISFFSDFYSGRSINIQSLSLFERMRDCGMIVKTHSMWGLPSYLVLFIRKREGRSKFTSQHFVQACFQDIKTHLFTLNSLLDNSSLPFDDELLEQVFAIEDVYQQLASASQNNCHKISMEVSSFQLDSSLEVSNSKIVRFHYLYDSFILPMLAFVADPDNELCSLSFEIVELCDRILELHTEKVSFSYHIRALKNSVNMIQEVIAVKILQAKNELDALFEVYREHRRIMDGINAFLEILNDDNPDLKKDLLEHYCLTSSKLRISNPSNRSCQTFINRSLSNKEAEHLPPIINIDNSLDKEDQIAGLFSFSDIKKRFMAEKTIPCILSFLIELFPGESVSFVVEKLFELEKYFPDNISVSESIKKFNIAGIQLELPERKWENK